MFDDITHPRRRKAKLYVDFAWIILLPAFVATIVIEYFVVIELGFRGVFSEVGGPYGVTLIICWLINLFCIFACLVMSYSFIEQSRKIFSDAEWKVVKPRLLTIFTIFGFVVGIFRLRRLILSEQSEGN
jgi:ascorbate-specific PTS system EIIC-type component UlaA